MAPDKKLDPQEIYARRAQAAAGSAQPTTTPNKPKFGSVEHNRAVFVKRGTLDGCTPQK